MVGRDGGRALGPVGGVAGLDGAGGDQGRRGQAGGCLSRQRAHACRNEASGLVPSAPTRRRRSGRTGAGRADRTGPRGHRTGPAARRPDARPATVAPEPAEWPRWAR